MDVSSSEQLRWETATAREEIERFLLDPESDPPSVGTLRDANLAAYAYSVLDPDHPDKISLRRDSMHATMRHVAVKSGLVPLLRAWQEAGIEALVFKGFYLAEFVYDIPAHRQYNDVDVVIHPEHRGAAADIAARLGWRESWHVDRSATMFAAHSQGRSPKYAGHELMNLDNLDVMFRLDVHRRVVHNEFAWSTVQERVTREAWRAAQSVAWEGATVRVLEAADSILMGLVMNRAWGRDAWRLKATDYLDFRMLVHRSGMSEMDLWSRARELGCERTLGAFLRRCDVFRQRLDLTPPTGLQTLRWGFEIARERGHPGLELALVHALDVPVRMRDMLRELPAVLRALARSKQIDDVMSSRTDETRERSGRPLSYREWQRIQRAVKRNLRLLGAYSDVDSGLLVLALYFALRRRGLAVALKGRAARPGDAAASSLWLELDGRVIPVVDAPAGPDPR